MRTPRISWRSRCGGHSRRWDVPSASSHEQRTFRGQPPTLATRRLALCGQVDGGMYRPQPLQYPQGRSRGHGRTRSACGMGSALPERAAARRLSGLRAVVEPPRALACDSSAPNAAPISPLVMYRPATRAAAPRSRLPAGTRPSGGPEAAAAGAPTPTCWKKMRCEDLQKSDQTLRDQKLDGRAHLVTRGGLTCSGLPPRSRSGAERALSAQALRADAAVERWLLRRSARGGAMRGSEAFCST